MKIKIFITLIIFFFQFYTGNVFAQSERDLRDLQDYAKRYDEEQRKKRVDEIERKLSGAPSKRAAEDAINNILWMIVAAIFLAVVWVYIDRRRSSRSADEVIHKAINDAYISIALKRLAPLSKDDILEMTIEEISQKISKPNVLIRESLKELGWSAKNFDGAKANAMSNNINSEAEKLIKKGVSNEEARFIAKEKILYEKKLNELKDEEANFSKSDLPLYLTIYAENPNDDITWYSICLDEKGNIVRGYKLFSESISESEISNGFIVGKNIEFETLKNPRNFGSNISIILHRKKFPAKAKYVAVYISASADFLEDAKYHKNLKIEFATDGFFSDSKSFTLSISEDEPTQIFIGLVDFFSNPKPTFIPARDMNLRFSDDYIINNEQDKSLLKSFQSSAVKLINKNS